MLHAPSFSVSRVFLIFNPLSACRVTELVIRTRSAETLYHGLLKSATSHQNPHLGREKRRLALERELEGSSIGEAEKRAARERLRVEENVWLRERRKKVGVKEFSKLKIIGHGQSCFCIAARIEQVRRTDRVFGLHRCFRGGVACQGEGDGFAIRDEAGPFQYRLTA